MNSLTNNFSESMETNLRDYGKLLILSGKIYNIIFKDKPDFSIDELLSLFVVNSESISNYNEFIETIFLQLESHFESNCANSTTAVRQTIK